MYCELSASHPVLVHMQVNRKVSFFETTEVQHNQPTCMETWKLFGCFQIKKKSYKSRWWFPAIYLWWGRWMAKGTKPPYGSWEPMRWLDESQSGFSSILPAAVGSFGDLLSAVVISHLNMLKKSLELCGASSSTRSRTNEYVFIYGTLRERSSSFTLTKRRHPSFLLWSVSKSCSVSSSKVGWRGPQQGVARQMTTCSSALFK